MSELRRRRNPPYRALPLAVTASWLMAVCVLPLEVDSYEFWLFMLSCKGYSVMMDTVPWAEMRVVKQNPELRAELFYRNYPFESVRATCVSNQLAELSIAFFVIVPAVPIHLLGGGWVTCLSSSASSTAGVGMLILKMVEEHGKRWSKIAAQLPGRSYVLVREDTVEPAEVVV